MRTHQPRAEAALSEPLQATNEQTPQESEESILEALTRPENDDIPPPLESGIRELRTSSVVELKRASLQELAEQIPVIDLEVKRQSRRKREKRAVTVSVKRMTKRERTENALLYPYPEDAVRPQTRGECADMPRPCPFVTCVHHLYLDVMRKTGAVKFNFPDIEPDEMAESCALDVADRLGSTLEYVAEVTNLTRERVRQIEVKALRKLELHPNVASLLEYINADEVNLRASGDKKTRLPLAPVVRDDHGDDDAECDDIHEDADGDETDSP